MSKKKKNTERKIYAYMSIFYVLIKWFRQKSTFFVSCAKKD
jgi:hypothetical protein